MSKNRIVIGITGGTGIILAYRTIHHLIQNGYFVDLIFSSAALCSAKQELGAAYASPKKLIQSLPEGYRPYITSHSIENIGATIASGSFITGGMAIIPCSMTTLAAVAMGLSDNLIRRAADVTLKERRRLVLVPRECPFSEIHLENMLKLSRMGASIVPPMPAWYSNPKTLADMEEGIVLRILDGLQLPLSSHERWQGI